MRRGSMTGRLAGLAALLGSAAAAWLAAAQPPRAAAAGGRYVEEVAGWRVEIPLPEGWRVRRIEEIEPPAVGCVFHGTDLAVFHLARPRSAGEQGPSLAEELQAVVASLLAGAQVQSTEELSAEGRPGRLVRSTGTWPEQAGGPPRRWEAWAVGRPEARYHFVAFGPGRAVEARPEVVRRMAMGMRAVRPSDGGADAGERHSLASDPPAAGGEQGPGGYAGGGTGTSPVTTGAIAPAPRELAQVPFRVSWQRRLEVGYQPGALQLVADPHGNLLFTVAAALTGRPPIARQLFVFAAGATEPRPTALSADAVAAFYAAATGERDRWGDAPAVVRFTELEIDAAGNVYLGIELAGSGHAAYVCYRVAERRYEVVASHRHLAALLAGPWGQVSHSVSVLVPVPGRADRAWLLAAPRVFGADRERADLPVRCASLQRNAEGLWVPSLLAPRLEPAPGTAGPPPLVLLGGRPDWQGGWVFAAPDGLWRMGADGAARPLVRLPLPQQGVRLSRPLVMPNGDVWIALNRELESGAHFTRNSPHRSPEVAGMWFAAGEPSRWVRVRLEGGQAQLAGIRGQRLLEALRGAGAPLEGGVVQTTQLRYEPASGGIAAFDAHHHLFFVLAPAD